MKTSVVYWSSSGNTQIAADELTFLVEDKGIAGPCGYVSDFEIEEFEDVELFFLGCSSMTNEEIEAYEFKPFYESLKIAHPSAGVYLFGSYDWGNGEWMDKWVQDAIDSGLKMLGHFIFSLEPDEMFLEKLKLEATGVIENIYI